MCDSKPSLLLCCMVIFHKCDAFPCGKEQINSPAEIASEYSSVLTIIVFKKLIYSVAQKAAAVKLSCG